MRYQAVLIDIDDTLLDYVPCCREAFDVALKALADETNISPAGKEDTLFQLFFGISGRLFSEAKHGLHTVAEVMELYPAEFVDRAGYPPQSVDTFKSAFRAAWGQTHTLITGAKETLEALHDKGYRLFAASNSFGHLQRNRLMRAGVLNYFEDTFISMDIGYDKPDRRFFDHALHALAPNGGQPVLPEEVLMVGDSMTTDIIGAKAAGMDTCFFNRRPDGQQDLSAADYVINSMPELLKIL